MKPEDLAKRLAFFLKVAKGLAFLTPTPVDDAIVAFMERSLGQQWFLDFLAFILSHLGPKGQAEELSEREFFDLCAAFIARGEK